MTPERLKEIELRSASQHEQIVAEDLGDLIAEVRRLKEIEAAAKSCASKLSVEYRRGSIAPRAEFDGLITAFGFPLV